MKKKVCLILNSVLVLVLAFSIPLYAQQVISHVTFEENYSPGKILVPTYLMNPISVALKNVPLDYALEEVSNKAGFVMDYSSDDIPLDNKVSVEMSNTTAIEVLISVLKNVDAQIVISKLGQIAITPVKKAETVEESSASSVLVAAQPEHSGVVTDENGEPLIGANVLVERSYIGSSTDVNGRFSFEYSPTEDYTLIVSYIGYKSVRQDLSPGDNVSNLSFELAQDPFGLDEIVVTGIASRTSKAVAEVAVTRIDMTEIADRSGYESLMTMIVGKAPGVTLQATDGKQGAPYRFTVRSGGGLHGDVQPLIIIDGVRTQQSSFAGMQGSFGNVGSLSSLSFLNSEEIESIEILKGPAGASAYGTDGTNGVVLISTKKGRLGAAGDKNWTISYKGTLGYNDQYRQFNKWDVRSFKEVNEFLKKGPIRKNNLNLSGGTQTIRYFFSLDKNFAESQSPGDFEDKSNYRVNLDMTPNEKLDVNITAGYHNGTIANVHGRMFANVRSSRNPWSKTPQEFFFLQNQRFFTNQFIGSISTALRPFMGGNKWLQGISGRFTMGVNDRDDRSIHTWDKNDVFLLKGERGHNQLNARNTTYTGDVRYDYNFLGITASANIGAQLYDNKNFLFEGQTTEFVTDLVNTIEGGDVVDTIRESDFHERKAGVFSEHSFSYDNTYYWSAMLRRDYVSVLKKGHESIYYPRISGSVRLDRFDWISDDFGMLKLRTAYGETGILPGRLDAIPTLYGPELFPYGVGVQVKGVGNFDLKPERVKELEIGIEAEYKGFLSVDFSYYRNNSTDAIIGVSKAPSQGFNRESRSVIGSFNDNVGKIEGSGFESMVQLFTSGPRFGGWSFNLTNITQWSTNEVIDLGGASTQRFHGIWSIEEGFEKGFARPTKGVKAAFDDEGFFNGSINSDGPISIGHMFPPWTGSFSSSLGAFGFNAYAMFEWKYNFWEIDGTLLDNTGNDADGLGSNILVFDIVREEL